MKLTVLVLSFNEVKKILQAVEEAKKIPIAKKEIIIIDNCSTDGTRELLKQLRDNSIRIIFQKRNLGAGKSVKVGLREACGEYVYVHHADLEYDYRDASRMLDLAEKHHYDVIFGSRFAKKEPLWALIKQRPENLATIISTFLVNYWYRKNFTDIIGSKLYCTDSIRKIPISTYGMGAEFEHISRMCKAGLKIGEICVNYRPRLNRSQKKIKPYHMISALFTLIKVRYFE